MSLKIQDVLRYFAYKYNGKFNKIYAVLEKKEEVNEKELADYDAQNKFSCVTAIDDLYPNILKEVASPPAALFYAGNMELLNEQLPIGAFSLDNGARFYSMVNININPNQLGIPKFDYLLMCEDPHQMDFLLNHMKSKGISFKSYAKEKNNRKDMERFH